ncbi:hypothetical protein PspLS_08122 [Pyricularia sp. CBS 133598]|nr:hypothetical protein PspLS_08122 [Pyricularia sp. CBS 133598]
MQKTSFAAFHRIVRCTPTLARCSRTRSSRRPRGSPTLLAAVVRANTAAVTPEYYRGQMQWAAGAPDMRFNDLNMPRVNGKTCMGFAWHNMQPYEKHNFGVGLPMGFRWPRWGHDAARERTGEMVLYPDEGLEVSFGMEES